MNGVTRTVIRTHIFIRVFHRRLFVGSQVQSTPGNLLQRLNATRLPNVSVCMCVLYTDTYKEACLKNCIFSRDLTLTFVRLYKRIDLIPKYPRYIPSHLYDDC